MIYELWGRRNCEVIIQDAPSPHQPMFNSVWFKMQPSKRDGASRLMCMFTVTLNFYFIFLNKIHLYISVDALFILSNCYMEAQKCQSELKQCQFSLVCDKLWLTNRELDGGTWTSLFFVCFASFFSSTVLLSLKLHELIFGHQRAVEHAVKKKKTQKTSPTISSHSTVVKVGKQTNTAWGLC